MTNSIPTQAHRAPAAPIPPPARVNVDPGPPANSNLTKAPPDHRPLGVMDPEILRKMKQDESNFLSEMAELIKREFCKEAT